MLASIFALQALALLAVALPPVILEVINDEDHADGFDPLHHLAGDSPYFNSPGVGLTVDVPEGCSRTLATYLFRHTDIYANDFEYENELAPFLYKLGNFSDRATFRDDDALAFLADWKSPIDNPEEQLEEGMNDTLSSVTLEIIAEGDEQAANSLTPHESCPAFDTSVGTPPMKTFVQTYAPPVAARLNGLAAPSFNWTADDVFAAQALCGYDTVIRGTESGFCKLFDENEWLALSSARLLTRDARENATNSSAASQSLFISFTHREEPPFIVTALGVLNETNATMTDKAINYERAWRTSYILPFLANIALERLECNATALGANTTANTFVRALVNAAPLPLPGCSTGPGGSCEIGAFRSFVEERSRLYGDFIGACGIGNETNATNTLGIYEGNLPANGSAVETETVQINGSIDLDSTSTAATPGSSAVHHNAAGLGLALLCSVAFALTITL
ncbi:phosphoglycerate mutase-like protein [Auricularia subglabra TFB-10046 SS5]|nr:phosphoglycerate mutase-like protein [Auricularia subglabra TFB-10046 SS5]